MSILRIKKKEVEKMKQSITIVNHPEFKSLPSTLKPLLDHHKDSRGTNDPKTFTTAVPVMTSAHGRPRSCRCGIIPAFSGHVDLMAVLWLLVLESWAHGLVRPACRRAQAVSC